MKLAVIVLTSIILLSLACKMDYDIEEVARQEHMGAAHNHETDDHDHEHEAEAAEHDSEHEESHEHDTTSGLTGSHRHVHDAGERNHGTGWFFNQPWAASFIWGKMVRDAVILLVLAAVIIFVSGYRRKHQ